MFLDILKLNLKHEIEYAIDYVEELLNKYKELTGLDLHSFVSGKGKHKTIHQKQYQQLEEYIARLKTYAKHIEICGAFYLLLCAVLLSGTCAGC